MSIKRNRGRAARIHKDLITKAIIEETKKISLSCCINRTENIKLIVSKQSISEKKNNRNLHLLYSTLNLETNSLSLSAKSKGVRPNSINHSTSIGIIKGKWDKKFLLDIKLSVVYTQVQDPNFPLKNMIKINKRIS